jgi:(p)ppGpp synthase/HD superfamily hydrolase
MTTEEMLRLKGIHIAPYIQLATELIGKTRKGGGNMFRHQIDTMGILLDYGYINSVLLKASLVHDVIEDIPGYNINRITTIDYDGPAVYELVMEVTKMPDEDKSTFLTRILKTGSKNAKVLKVADRISNMVSLGFVNKQEFVKRYTEETVRFVYPIAEEVDVVMLKELKELVESRRKYSEVFSRPEVVHIFEFPGGVTT